MIVCLDIKGSIEQFNQLNLASGGELTIDSGAVTITHSIHTIDTESDAGTDDLATINGGSAGDILLLGRAHSSRAIVLKHNVGNIRTPSGTDHELTALGFVILKHDGSNWQLQAGNGSGYLVNKLSCLTVATSNIDLADEQVINGVFCGETARVFLTGQTDKRENGPWDVVAAAASDPGTWTRPVDFQEGFSVSGHIFCIEQGTLHAGSVWMIRNYCGQDLVGVDDLNPVLMNGAEFNINSLTAESTNSDSDLIVIFDISAGEMRKQTRGDFLAGVSGGSSVPTSRTISAGVGLSGGGDLTVDRTINLDINGLAAESTANDADFIVIYDVSIGELRKQTRSDFLAGVAGGSGVPTSRTISAGIGLSGGGDLTENRTINLDFTGLTAESTPDNSDLVLIYDASAEDYRTQTREEFLSGVILAEGPSLLDGQLLFAGGTGTLATPQFSHEYHTNTGFYISDSEQCGISIDSTKVFSWTDEAVEAWLPGHFHDDLQIDGNTTLSALRLLAKTADPTPEPSTGQGYIWISDGTGSGDDGDLMLKIRAGGVTKTITLADFSSF